VSLAPGVKRTILKWGSPGPGNENFLAELSQRLAAKVSRINVLIRL